MKQTLLFYPVRIAVVLTFFGYLCAAIGIAALFPLIASVIFQEWLVTPYYLFTSLFSLALGWGLTRIRRLERVQLNEVVAVVCLSYLYAASINSISLMAGGLDWVDAFFEAVSGITTTGLTMISDWKGTPRTTFLSRAWLQWIGGLGIMLFSLIYFFRQGELTKQLSRLEAKPEDLFGGSKAHAKGVLLVYVLLSLAGVLGMLFLGSSLYDSLLFVMSSVSTGGFSHLPDSIASLGIFHQVLLLFLAFICAVSLFFYYRLWSHRITFTQQGVQVFGLLGLAVLVSLVLGARWDDWLLGFSSQTTTGFSTNELGQLNNGRKLFVIFSMLIGGGVGSTAGGIKVLRFFLFFTYLKQMIVKQGMTKHAYYKPKLFALPVSESQFHNSFILISLFTLCTAFSWLCFVFMGYAPLDSLFEVASAMGTVGLSSGVTSTELPLFLKFVLCFDMLLGRVEIVPWLVIFYPRTWLGQHLEES